MREEIKAYIDAFDGRARADLALVYETIRAALPDEPERISWGMPTFGKNVIHFAGAKRHVGIYPGPEAVEHFAPKLDSMGYKHTKGAIQLPYGRVDLGLVSKIALWCGEHSE
jgi:uncharacterized protein YdhG (YjbR/CyaY superfamily)